MIGRVDPRTDLVRHYRWLRQHGLNDSHSGNASVRVGETVWVTPTGACADALEASDLVRCALAGPPGERASLDTPLHLATYRVNPGHGALLHSHCPHAVALTLGGGDYEPPDFEAQYYFGRVPVLDIPYVRYLAESPAQVAQTLARSPVVIVRGHGVYAAAADLNLAYKWTCSLELSAKTAYLARTAGVIP
jgi:L-fuculose-phosphate aldolase